MVLDERNGREQVRAQEALTARPGQSLPVYQLASLHSETLDKVSVSTTFGQSRLVSVSTPFKFLGLEESRSRHLSKFPVSKSLGLDIFCFLSLADSLSLY